MKPTLQILKLGGKLLEQEQLRAQALQGFITLPGHKILVHGGGNKASELLDQLGIAPKMINGRRITDDPTLDVVIMVYGGLINKKLVAQLQALGINALGLSGADANVIIAHKRPVKEIDYGWAGDIDQINPTTIQQLLQLGLCPVFCALTHDQKGQLLNTNADTIASSLATAMAPFFEVKLFLCFEKKGVLADPEDNNSIVPHLNPTSYREAKASGIISGGMIAKLDNAFHAIAQGVNQIVIGDPDSLKGIGGTSIRAK